VIKFTLKITKVVATLGKIIKFQALVRIFSSFKQKRTASKIEKTKKCHCSTKIKPTP
jgi:hypothetical protein